jgi:mannose-6-phosphate isomerase class I
VKPRRLGHLGANELWEILATPYFRLERLVLKEDWHSACDGSTFHVLFVHSGAVSLETDGHAEILGPGVTCLIPAGLSGYRLGPGAGAGDVLRITTP